MTAPTTEVEGNQLTVQPVLMDTAAVSEGSCEHNGNIASSSPCSAAEFRASPTHTGPGEPEGSLLYQCASEDLPSESSPDTDPKPQPQEPQPCLLETDSVLPVPAMHSEEEAAAERERLKQKAKQDYFEFKEKIGRLSTSCGDSYAGDLVAVCREEFVHPSENYLRGCKWSPDGQMLMVNSNDNYIRMFHIPDAVFNNQWDVNVELRSSLKVMETDLIFDFCWYPGLTTDNSSTCLFATTCRETPIHLFSALTGELVGSYRPYNNVDEIVAAHSIGFTSDGKYLVSGFNRTLRCFDTNRPGRDCVITSTVSKEKDRRGHLLSLQGQRGILSCFAAHPTSPSLVAAGAFNGDVAIYNVPDGSMTAMFEGQSGGITHVSFSKDGNYLFAGGRKDPEINCFDIRNPEKVLYVMYRYVATNQRMYFDVDGSSRYLLSGNHNGKVSVWDLKGQAHPSPHSPFPQLDPIINFQAHQDATNGCSINPKQSMLATCSGQRHFNIDIMDDDEMDDSAADSGMEENTLKLWNLRLPS